MVEHFIRDLKGKRLVALGNRDGAKPLGRDRYKGRYHQAYDYQVKIEPKSFHHSPKGVEFKALGCP
jgi:hypothetical protein